LPQNSRDGGPKKEAKPGPEKMNVDLGGEDIGRQEGKTLGQKRRLKKPWAGEEEKNNSLLRCVWVHPQNGLNSLILNWCTGGCWFTPAAPTNAESGHRTS